MTKTRIDRWLWSVRIFKSRTLATKVCKAGNVKNAAGMTLKPSSEISEGDVVTVRKNGINFVLEVRKVINKRVSAPLARECYVDKTPEEELKKYENWFVSASEFRSKGKGRPTKKERREIEEFKGNIPSPFDWDDWSDWDEWED